MQVTQKPQILQENLLNTIHLWGSGNSDLVIISQEGSIINTNKLILALHSKHVRNMLEYSVDIPGVIVGISVPASITSIKSVLKLIEYGFETSSNFIGIEETANTAKLLGIKMESLVAENVGVKEEILGFDFNPVLDEPSKSESSSSVKSEITGENVEFNCKVCAKTFSRNDHLRRHTQKQHSIETEEVP